MQKKIRQGYLLYCTVSANNLLKKLKWDLFETKKIINFISNFFLKEAPQKPREHHSRQVEDGEGGGGRGEGGGEGIEHTLSQG